MIGKGGLCMIGTPLLWQHCLESATAPKVKNEAGNVPLLPAHSTASQMESYTHQLRLYLHFQPARCGSGSGKVYSAGTRLPGGLSSERPAECSLAA